MTQHRNVLYIISNYICQGASTQEVIQSYMMTSNCIKSLTVCHLISVTSVSTPCVKLCTLETCENLGEHCKLCTYQKWWTSIVKTTIQTATQDQYLFAALCWWRVLLLLAENCLAVPHLHLDSQDQSSTFWTILLILFYELWLIPSILHPSLWCFTHIYL